MATTQPLNVRMNKDNSVYSQYNPSIVIDPRDSNNLYAVWFDQSGQNDRFTFYRSTNGGDTGSVVPYGLHQHFGNYKPTLAFDTLNNYLWCAFASSDTANRFNKNGLFAIRSGDGGVHWSDNHKWHTIVDHDTASGGTVFEDDVAMTIYNGSNYSTLHATWTSKYDDGNPKNKISYSNLSSTAADGDDFLNGKVLWGDVTYHYSGPAIATARYNATPGLFVVALRSDNKFVFRYSDNGGSSFYPSFTPEDLPAITPISSISFNYQTFQANSFPSIALRKTGVTDEQIFIVYASEYAGSKNIYFSHGYIYAGGYSFSDPVRINTEPGMHWAPKIILSPDQSKLFIIYYSNTPGNNFADVLVAASRDWGETFSHTKVNSEPIVNIATYGDYIGIASNNSEVFPVWSGLMDPPQTTGLDVFLGKYKSKYFIFDSKDINGSRLSSQTPRIWNGHAYTGPWIGDEYRSAIIPPEILQFPVYTGS